MRIERKNPTQVLMISAVEDDYPSGSLDPKKKYLD